MSNTWQGDPFAFGDDPLHDVEFEPAAEGESPDQPATTPRRERGVTLLALASLAGAAAALVMGASHTGWATVAVGTLAYLLAVASDLRQRQMRRSRRRYDRPWATALLRLVVFWAAVAAAWLAASGLAAA